MEEQQIPEGHGHIRKKKQVDKKKEEETTRVPQRKRKLKDKQRNDEMERERSLKQKKKEQETGIQKRPRQKSHEQTKRKRGHDEGDGFEEASTGQNPEKKVKASPLSISEQQKKMADWNKLGTVDDIKKSDLRIVQSKLFAKTSNSACNSMLHTVTGDELNRRVKWDHFKTEIAGRYLGLSHSSDDKNGLGHNTTNLKKIINILRGNGMKPDATITYAFTLLQEDEVQYLCSSMSELAAGNLNRSVTDKIKSDLKAENMSEAAINQAIEVTRMTMTTAIAAIAEEERFSNLLHGGVDLFTTIWNIINSVLPQ